MARAVRSAGVDVSEVRTAWPHVAGFVNAATLGLPPASVSAALHDAVTAWSTGQGCAVDYDRYVQRARGLYADLVGVPSAWVSLGAQTSVFVGMVAASLSDGATVVVPEGDFSSLTFPFMAQADRGITVRHVPLADLADAVDDGVDLVAFSLAQSACGTVCDAASIYEAAHRHGARTLVDITQAVGWMPVDAARADMTVCSAYKWLCQPRGTAYFTVRPEVAAGIRAVNAGWYAGDGIWTSTYGPAMALSPTASRFDVSPAWLSWVGAVPALELFASADMATVRDYDLGLSRAVAERIGIEPRESPVLTFADPDGQIAARLTASGVTFAERAGKVRVAFHLWNDESDVELVARAVTG